MVHTTDGRETRADPAADRTPGDLGRVFFCSGGSEAVESAVKIAKQVQVMRGYPLRFKVIARRGSYHGATHGAASLSHWTEPYVGPPMPGIVHVPNPNRYRPNFPGLAGAADNLACAAAVEQEIRFQGSETVAAVIAEPISVANGVHVPAAAYWGRLREICDRHGVLLIADEVITGWGRTGRWFALGHMGVVPDLRTTGQGAHIRLRRHRRRRGPAGGGRRVQAGGNHPQPPADLRRPSGWLRRRPGQDQDHRPRGVGPAVGRSGGVSARPDGRAAAPHHPTVGDVRGLGLLCGVELVKDKATKERFGRGHPFLKRVAALLDERGVTTRVWDMLHLAPPLVVSTAELDRLVEAVDAALTRAEREFAAELG